MVFCGKTGINAALAHSPTTEDGRRKYVFFVAPHIAISKQGEIGVVYRNGKKSERSSACGALCALKDNLENNSLNVRLDPLDMEQSLLRQLMVENLDYGSIPDLLTLTRVCHKLILEQIENLIQVTIDASIDDYAVLSGIQIHGPKGSNFFWPGSMYLFSNGERIDLTERFDNQNPGPIMRDMYQRYSARLLLAASNGDLVSIKRYVSQGVPLNICDYDSRTALHLSTCEGQIEVVQYLLKNLNNVNMKDRWGNTALDRATDEQIIELLTNNGAMHGVDIEE
eukprot:TRINITY_DN1948_c0_g1_i2.p1 TRINITY_DN1948_c0_g1~~TRINITY_DN1948_c0_g1_i2.p1  ORF type:complete len:282 (+),score=57.24 TRINITY_DN1948_c0_g1_i2:361-1206(+)